MVLRFLCVLSVVAISWSADMCSEEGSLMQGQARQLRNELISLSHAGFNTNNASASRLLQSVKEMAGSMNSMKRIDDDAVLSFESSLAAVKEAIVDSKDVIDREHLDAQGRINVAGDFLTSCQNSAVFGSGRVGILQDNVSTLSQTHSTCRVTEQTLTGSRDTACNA